MADVFETATEKLGAAIAAYEGEIDPARTEQKVAEEMAPYGADGLLKRTPKSERARIEQTIRAELKAELKQAQGEALFRLAEEAHAHEPLIEAAIQAAQEPPDSLTAYHRWTNTGGASRQEQFNVFILAELQQARFERKFAAPRPRQVLAAYEAALRDPYSPECAGLIRFIEQQHAARWTWADGVAKDDTEVAVSNRLSQLVTATRQARIPPAAGRVRELLARAKTLRREAADLHKIEMRRPA